MSLPPENLCQATAHRSPRASGIKTELTEDFRTHIATHVDPLAERIRAMSLS
jgi:hypothetical protein